MITYENAVCFVLGFALIYMTFRAMGILVIALILTLPGSLRAQTNYVLVANDSPVPVVITAQSTPDFWPALSAGMSFGFVVCCFGWKIRMARRTTSRDF